MADDECVLAFYDTLAAGYHLIFADWVAAVEWQGRLLDTLIRAPYCYQYLSADRA